MHQPWASLLVYGIKRIEGRTWAAPIRVRFLMRLQSKQWRTCTEHYPVSRLLGIQSLVLFGTQVFLVCVRVSAHKFGDVSLRLFLYLPFFERRGWQNTSLLYSFYELVRLLIPTNITILLSSDNNFF
ncbi:hypothetical protein ACE6H2_022386 [Prunus campanulata]